MRDGAAYRAKSLPPLELTYSTARIDERVRELSPDARTGLPEGVDGRRYRWADLDGDGVAGTLSEQDGAWYYARNRSPASAPPDTERASVATFAPAAALESRPSLAAWTSTRCWPTSPVTGVWTSSSSAAHCRGFTSAATATAGDRSYRSRCCRTWLGGALGCAL